MLTIYKIVKDLLYSKYKTYRCILLSQKVIGKPFTVSDFHEYISPYVMSRLN